MAAACLLALALVVPGVRAVADEPTLVVVVHPSRTEPLTADDVARIFLRRRRLWADGSPIVPLNLDVDSAERRTFTVRVLRDDTGHLAQYWNEQYFAGIFPPTVLGSSAAVRRYVATERNAIGYLRVEDADASVRIALEIEPRPEP